MFISKGDSVNMKNGNVYEKIYDWIEEHKREIINFCHQFIEYKSVTGDELEVQCEFLLPFLKNEMKWDEIDYFNLAKGKERPNINAVLKGLKDYRSLLINGHVDVVPVPQAQLSMWSTEPWKPTIKNGRIYGRGSNDMKGGISSAIWAIKALMDLDVKLKGTLVLELVIGEELMEHEIGTTGATKRLLDQGYTFQFCIIPEPTNCEIHTISAGAFDFEIIIQGKDVHDGVRNLVLYPQRWGLPSGNDVGVDALSKLIDIIKIFEKLEREWVHKWRHPILGSGGYLKSKDYQGVGCFSINPSIVEAGTYYSSVPGYARAHFNCYYPPWISYEEAVNEIKRVINAYASTDNWLREKPPKLVVNSIWPPYEVEVNHLGCQILASAWKKAVGNEAIFSGFKAVDDVSFVQALDIPGVSFGPGDISMGAHGPDEYVPIDHIINCAKALATFIIDWCG